MTADLLPSIDPTSVSLPRIRRKYRVCKMVGHIYYMTSYDDKTGRMTIECQRCWPHINSRKAGTLYDLLPTPELVHPE